MSDALRFDSSGNATMQGTITSVVASQGVITTNATGLFNPSVGSNGQVMVGGGAHPAWANITSPLSSISITNGANALSVDIANYAAKTPWTPVLSFGGASVGITYSVQTGYYTRCGSLVSFAASIALSSKGSSSGAMAIGGLPFSAALITALNIQTGGLVYLAGQIQASITGSSITLVNTLTGSLVSILSNTFFSNTANIQISGSIII